MKIVAINGSPRKEGNTAALLKAVVEEHKDVDLVYHDLVDLKVKDCLACMYCKTHDKCSIRDDMTKIYKDLRECDAMIFASPIYMGGETALMKAVWDRMYALLAAAQGPKKYEPRLEPGKKFVVLFTCGNPRGDEAMGYLKDRLYQVMALQGMSKGQVHIVGGVLPSMNIMELAAAPKVVDEVKRFLKH